jgi:hypothetical protein
MCIEPDHGLSFVDFQSLDDAKHCIEQWWQHLCRGEVYRMPD